MPPTRPCCAAWWTCRRAATTPGGDRLYGVTLRVRIGVNTVEVIAPGGEDASQVIVASDAVNVAARLEQAAPPGTVLVGRRTYAATKRAFRFEGPIALRLKGKEGTVDGYRVLAPEAGMEGMRAPIGLATGIVGRGREIDALMTTLDTATAAKQVRTVLVCGSAGIGKSRLVRELGDRVGRLEPGPTVYHGRCLAAGRGIAFWALGEIVKGEAGILESDAAETAARKLERAIDAVVEDERDRRWLRSHMPPLVGLQATASSARGAVQARSTRRGGRVGS